ncbi:hypothetical protein B0H13DRAFT_2109687, partial [Mycena leptocephala]
ILWQVNLRALGNWSLGRKPHTALQQIVLNGGRDYGDIFSKYKVAVGEVINYIYHCLDYHPQDSSTESQSMTISRRVFTQVTSWSHNSRRVLEPGDDSPDHMCSLNDEWKVLSKVNIGMQGRPFISSSDYGACVAACLSHCGTKCDDAMMVLRMKCAFSTGLDLLTRWRFSSWIIDDDNIYLNADLGFPLPEGALVVCGATFTIDCS